jgi:hypothetical protein
MSNNRGKAVQAVSQSNKNGSAAHGKKCELFPGQFRLKKAGSFFAGDKI